MIAFCVLRHDLSPSLLLYPCPGLYLFLALYFSSTLPHLAFSSDLIEEGQVEVDMVKPNIVPPAPPEQPDFGKLPFVTYLVHQV
jgi:hypothetical protein